MNAFRKKLEAILGVPLNQLFFVDATSSSYVGNSAVITTDKNKDLVLKN